MGFMRAGYRIYVRFGSRCSVRGISIALRVISRENVQVF